MRKEKEKVAETTRFSVSLKTEDYVEIEKIAANKKVSIAWVIREAVDQYLDAERPLFKSR